MNRYIVTYDLSAPVRDYYELYKRIGKFEKCILITESSWAIETRKTAAQIRDYLEGALDDNDKLLVARIGDWASYNLHEVANLLNSSSSLPSFEFPTSFSRSPVPKPPTKSPIWRGLNFPRSS